MMQLFKYWPRQIAYPERQRVKDFNSFIYLLNKYNHMKDKIYFSVYDCNDAYKFDDCHLDKIAFDLDSKDAIRALIKLHNKLQQKNIKHLMIFSTKGFWCYVFTKNYENLKNKKQCLTNAQKFIAQQCDLTIGLGEGYDIDQHIIGDVARIARMPLSFDNVRKLYCIGVSIEDLEKGYEYIRIRAQQPSLFFNYYGTKLFDISKFDAEKPEVDRTEIADFKIQTDDKLIDDFLPCIRRVLLDKGKDTYNNRYLFALYCREIGLSKSVCDSIAKEYFSRVKRTDGIGTNYDHFKKYRVAEYAYNRHQDFFPRCEKLKDICCKGCKQKLYR